MKDSLKVAVIGAGDWGKRVISEYLQLAKCDVRVDLSMVCDSEEKELRYCNQVFGVPRGKLTKDYSEVLGSNAVDAVHICTPNETHHRICMEALYAGKHTLLEKPMALNAGHAWEMVGAAEHRGLILQVGHIFRFNNALRMMRDLVEQNFFGQLYYLKLQWTTLTPSPMGRDIIFDLGPHPIDILNYLLKKWPARVDCKAKAYRRKFLEELAYFTVEFDDTLMAHVELSWLQPGKVRQLNVIGSKKSAAVDCLGQSIQIFENGYSRAFSLDVVKNNTIFDEVSHFAESILTARNSYNSGNVGAANVVILEGLTKSLKESRTIKVDLRE